MMNYDMEVFPTGNGDSCLKIYVGEKYEVSVAFDRGNDGRAASDIRVFKKRDSGDTGYCADVTEVVLGDDNYSVQDFGTILEVIQIVEKLK
jgi:hypothetical protein